MMYFLFIATAFADVPPPKSQRYISTAFKISNLDKHQDYVFFVGPLESRSTKTPHYKKITERGASFTRMHRGRKDIYAIAKSILDERSSKHPKLVLLTALQGRLKKIEDNSAASPDDKRLKSLKSEIRSLEREIRNPIFDKQLVSQLVRCQAKVTTRYVADAYEGNVWLNRWKITRLSGKRCVLKRTFVGYK